jgi:hypothetical protein
MQRAAAEGRCLQCGRRLSKGWWSYCYRCWREKRAALNSWHHQLEQYMRERFTPEQLNEVYAMYIASLSDPPERGGDGQGTRTPAGG